jgi:Domain of unknown function (DUF4157)
MSTFAPLQRKRAKTTSSVRESTSSLQPSRGFERPKTTPASEIRPNPDQRQAARFSLAQIPIERPKENHTGLPDTLKAGIENFSGISLDDVKVHYYSPKPAEVQALAYTQGTNIHVGPGQEKHLAHEAWHVVQQKQGRVRPTTRIGGVAVNEDRQLEREAAAVGIGVHQGIGHHWQSPIACDPGLPIEQGKSLSSSPIQYMKSDAEKYIKDNKLDLEKVSRDTVEEYINDESNPKAHRTGLLNAWNEGQTSRYTIPEPDDLESSTSEYESDEAEKEENNPAKLPDVFKVTRSKGEEVSLPSFDASPSSVKTVGYAQRKRRRDSTFAVTHPTESGLSGEFALGAFGSSDFVYFPHNYEGGEPKRAQRGPTYGTLSSSADRVVKRLKSEEGLSKEEARTLVSQEIYGQTRGEEFDDRILDKEKAPLFHFGQVLLADKARSSDARSTIQEALDEHNKSFSSRFPDVYKPGAYPGSGGGGRKRLREKRNEES